MTGIGFEPFRRKMLAANLPRVAIDTFAHYYRLVRDGETGMITGEQIEPVETLTGMDSLSNYQTMGIEVLSRLAVIKLNGGLGTSMGMAQAKSLLPVKENLSFLDIIVRQVLRLREAHHCQLYLRR